MKLPGSPCPRRSRSSPSAAARSPTWAGVFDYDEYGNYCTQFTRDGQDVYYAVRVRDNGTVALRFACPEGTIENYNPGLWMSLVEIN